MEEYLSVKTRLFAQMPVRERVIDIDDLAGADLAAQVGTEWTVGRSPKAHVRATKVRLGRDSSGFTLVTPAGEVEVRLPLAGDFNVSNALVAAGCGLALGIDTSVVVEGLEHVNQVPGRMERIDEGQPFAVLVDYAHTPDALAKAVAAVREVTPGRVITVFGCGGDRDPEKRPLMGEAASRLSDVVVLTTDNPRSENPVGIVRQIEDGLSGGGAVVYEEPDRSKAIALALSIAEDGDAVLIAGKGHEDYQILADEVIHFDDREVARRGLAGMRDGAPRRC
jgi:UDP-N-acetylmuramoyl-L-alanyl-D-glutamate--2,6-diaminopimelate ligase